MAEDPAGCSVPLILRALIMLGCHKRDDAMALVMKFADSIRFDGGWMCKRLLDKRADRKSCYKAALAGLYLYAECEKKGIPLPHKENLLVYFLKRDVFFNSEKTVLLSGDGRFGWRFIDNFFPVEPMRMGLPLTLSALAILGAGDHPALKKAWDLLDAKRDTEGRFALDGTLTKQPCSFGSAGKPNKWITYYAELAYMRK